MLRKLVRLLRILGGFGLRNASAGGRRYHSFEPYMKVDNNQGEIQTILAEGTPRVNTLGLRWE